MNEGRLSILQLRQMSEDHLKRWRPKEYKEMERASSVRVETMALAKQAEEEQRQLIRSGMRDYEAQEIYMPKYILLKPEEGVE